MIRLITPNFKPVPLGDWIKKSWHLYPSLDLLELPRLHVEIGNKFSMYWQYLQKWISHGKFTKWHTNIQTYEQYRGYQLLCKQLIHVGEVINQIVDVRKRIYLSMCPADVFWPRWLREDEESLIFNAKVNLVSTTEFNINLEFLLVLILNDF